MLRGLRTHADHRLFTFGLCPWPRPPGADRRSPGFQDLLACRSRVRGRAPGFPPGGSGAASLASCTVLGKVAPSPPVELSGSPAEPGSRPDPGTLSATRPSASLAPLQL